MPVGPSVVPGLRRRVGRPRALYVSRMTYAAYLG